MPLASGPAIVPTEDGAYRTRDGRHVAIMLTRHDPPQIWGRVETHADRHYQWQPDGTFTPGRESRLDIMAPWDGDY